VTVGSARGKVEAQKKRKEGAKEAQRRIDKSARKPRFRRQNERRRPNRGSFPHRRQRFFF
jgi:hypothetical protein